MFVQKCAINSLFFYLLIYYHLSSRSSPPATVTLIGKWTYLALATPSEVTDGPCQLSPKDSPPSLAIDLFASLLCPRGGEHSRIGKEKRNQPPALLLIPCLLFAVCGRRVVAKKVIVIGLASNVVAVIY